MNNSYSSEYPNDPKFEELLTSCGSMTAQLKQLHYKFSVEVIEQNIVENIFFRISLLKLNDIPVIIAYSSCKISDQNFYNILLNAENKAIGYYLFSQNSQISRDSLDITHLQSFKTHLPRVTQYLINRYPNQQHFWQRTSLFSHKLETLKLTEIILPEITLFFNHSNSQ